MPPHLKITHIGREGIQYNGKKQTVNIIKGELYNSQVLVNNLQFRISGIEEHILSEMIPGISFDASLDIRGVDGTQRLSILTANAKITLKGNFIASSETLFLTNLSVSNSATINGFFIPLPRDILSVIESRRENDLPLQLQINILYSYQISDKSILFGNEQMNYDLKYSHHEWMKKLKAMGYGDAWLIEIRTPLIDGLDEAEKHLEKANECLIKRDYEGCMINTRAAWNSVKGIIEKNWTNIAAQIDVDSPGQSNQDPKSKRIDDIRGKIHYFSNIGDHKEAYRVNPEDALLSYHLTISMLSYLSKYTR